MASETPGKLWRRAGHDRARYLELLRDHGFIYERADGATVHTARNPVSPAPHASKAARRRTASRAVVALGYDSVLERDFQAQVLELLKLNRWVSYHTHDSRRSTAGFPDIVALHPASGDRLVMELKTEKGRATPEQLQWLAHFEACGIEAQLYRPSMIDDIIKRVRKARA